MNPRLARSEKEPATTENRIHDDTSDGRADDRDAGGRRTSGVGDDERENREYIAETGQPKRDALGNADGAS